MDLETDKVYVWSYINDQFQVRFLYKDEELRLNRNLIFSRNMSESISLLFTRISLKISQSVKRKEQRKNVTRENKSEQSNINIQLIKDGIPINDTLTCQEIFFDNTDNTTTMLLKIANKTYSVIINSPIIRNVSLPKYMMVGFPVYPAKFNVSFTNINETEYQWYRMPTNKLDKIPVGNEYLYIPTLDDIGCKLKLICIPKNNGVTGLAAEITSNNEVEGGPGFCPFQNRHIFTPCVLSSQSFRIVTYNILADMYIDTDIGKAMFENCPSYALSIDYRKQLLLKELCGYNADLICLQEVDKNLYEKDLSNILSCRGLEGIYFKKGGTVREGIAMFFRKSRFRMLGNKGYILGTDIRDFDCLKDIWDVLTKNEVVTSRFVERTTVFQVVTLEHIETQNVVLLANTHLYFHPDADHIRLIQAGMAIYIINDMVKKLYKDNPKCNVSVIFCGDFNSTPDSGIFQLFTKNEVPADYIGWNKKIDEAVVGLSLKQPLQLDSACGTPNFTHYTNKFNGCLDYIFYEKDKLHVEQVIPLPDIEEIIEYGGLPNPVFPSDHISLVADLKWK